MSRSTRWTRAALILLAGLGAAGASAPPCGEHAVERGDPTRPTAPRCADPRDAPAVRTFGAVGLGSPAFDPRGSGHGFIATSAERSSEADERSSEADEVGLRDRAAVVRFAFPSAIPSAVPPTAPSPPPALPARGAAIDLAETLDAEARELLAESQRMQTEVALGLAARGRLRSAAAFLLQTGAARGWDDSAPVVAGIRLSGILRRCDALIAAALDGRATRDGRPLEADEARAAIDAVGEIARIDLGRIRSACGTGGALAEVRLANALAETLAPLAKLSEVVEGIPLPDPWPAGDAILAPSPMPTAPTADGITNDPDADEARRLAAGLPSGARRERALQALAILEKGTAPDRATWPPGDRRLAREAVALCAALVGQAASERGGERGLENGPGEEVGNQLGNDLEAVLDVVLDVVLAALQEFASSGAADRGESRDRLTALVAVVGAAHALVDAERGEGWTSEGRARLATAATALLAGELARDARARVPAATQVRSALETLGLVDDDARTGSSAPDDLKDARRRLRRDADAARAALPEAFVLLASNPGNPLDPTERDAMTKMLAIRRDSARIDRLQSMVAAIRPIDPKAARAFVGVARRLARDLGDPARRAESERTIDAADLLFMRAFPLPYEDEVRRRGDAALERTGGRAAELAEAAAAARLAWIREIADGTFDGPAARRLDLVSRLFTSLQDLDGVDAPITREGGDRLATWGAWASRRATLAPAAADPIARATLASRSLLEARGVGAAGVESARTFERDVQSLERSIPLVRLAAGLERMLGPSLTAPPDSVAALLAPLLRAPPPDALLLAQWPRLRRIDRALFEMEHARRIGDLQLLDALSRYAAAIADETASAIWPPPATFADDSASGRSNQPDAPDDVGGSGTRRLSGERSREVPSESEAR